MSGSSSRISLADLQRHPEIWFDDGNIVLVACQTAYRVYRGLLAAQSTVFHDMFASSTASPDETFDGCPVVHLSDSPHDLTHLLRVLLPKSQISYRTPKEDSPRTFDEVSAVVRLAHKYNIPQVQAQALASLQEHHFPSTFADFSNASSREPEVDMKPAHFIGAVNLARLTDTPLMLPMALCRCCYLDGALVDGWAHEDGTVEHLCAEDLKRCIDGRLALERERSFLVYYLFDGNGVIGVNCQHPTECQATLAYRYELMMAFDHVRRHLWLLGDRARREEHERKGSEALPGSWILEFFATAQPCDRRNILCAACAKRLHERNEEEQKKIFHRLPKIFGIAVEGWGKEKLKSNTEGESEPAVQ